MIDLPYRAVNRVRRALYRRGILRAKRLHRPVISVGNIAIGGAGKTPAVIAIGRFFLEHGFRVAVLTRGYGREGDATGVMDDLDARRWGDEPVVIKRRLAKADVIIGSNRYENAIDKDYDVFLLDDGFQHLQLARDADIVIDAPARWYREGRSALRDATFVIPRNLRTIVPPELARKRVFAFAGLANNEQFFATLETVGTRGFPDHHRYTAADLDAIRQAARDADADAIVTTEKDAVKIGADDILTIGAEFVIDPGVLERLLQLVRQFGQTS
ncbi:MAG TPA: tetraacyldisaccharide 4'-kinase [Thermoanaerobaculia bacterium]|nr:tetraacyldisaccharide 4'-kinase [Thermoanaerobaculia bacterium]